MADIKKIIEIEYKLSNGDTVKTTNEAVIAQFVALGDGYKVTKTAADELSTANEALAESTENLTQVTQENTQAQEQNAEAQEGNADKGKKLEKQTNETGKSMKSLKAQLAEAKNEMAAAAENFGTGSEQFNEASLKAGALKDQIESFNRTLEASKSPLDASIGALQGIAGAYGIAQSASALFGKENEDVQKALLKVQAALTLVQSIDALGDSIESFKSLKNTVLESTIVTKAYAAASAAAAAAQKFLSSPIETTKNGLKSLGEGLKNTGSSLKGSLGSLKDFGANLKGNITSGLKSFGDGIKNLPNGLKSLKSGIGSSETAFKGLRGAIIGTGIGALAIGLIMLVTNFDKVKQVVLNLFPGLKGLADFIGNLVQGITDFLGITSEADRAAEELDKKSKSRQKSGEREIELARARGASDEELYKLEKKNADKRIKDLDELRKLKGKLNEEELEEYTDLIQKKAVLDATETKRLADEAKKRAEDAKKKQEEADKEAAAKAKAAADKAAAERKAAGDAFKNVVAKLNEDLQKLNKSSYEIQRIDAQKAYDTDLAVLKTALSKKAVSQKEYNDAVAKLDANRAAKTAEITKKEGEDAAKIFETNTALLADMQAAADDASVAKRQEVATAKLNAAKQAQLDELATAETNALEALTLEGATEEKKLALKQQYTDLRTGLDTAYANAVKKSNADIQKDTDDKAKADLDNLKAKEQEKIKIALDAGDKTSSISTKYYDDLAKIYDDDTKSFEDKEKDKLALTQQYNSDILAENKRRIEQEIALQEAAAQQDPKRLEELKLALAKINSDITKNEADEQEKRRQDKLAAAEAFVNDVQQFVDALSGLGDAISELYQAQIDEIDRVTEKSIEASNTQKDAELANKELTSDQKNAIEERYQREQLVIQAKAEADKKALQKKQADIQFAIQVANIITATALAVIQALAQLGPIAGAIAGVLIGATGVAQIAVANKQRQAVQALAKGGLVTGPGGPTDDSIPARLSNGEAVINAAAVKRFAPILSAINQSTGGVPIDAPKFALGGTASDALLLGINDRLNSIAITQTEAAPTRAYILDTDVSSASVKNSRIRRTSTY
jgi:hypothetical protein